MTSVLPRATYPHRPTHRDCRDQHFHCLRLRHDLHSDCAAWHAHSACVEYEASRSVSAPRNRCRRNLYVRCCPSWSTDWSPRSSSPRQRIGSTASCLSRRETYIEVEEKADGDARDSGLTINLRIEDDKLRPDLGGTFALQQRHQTAQILQIECVAGARTKIGVIIMPYHGAVQPRGAQRRTRYKLAQRLEIRYTALKKDMRCI